MTVETLIMLHITFYHCNFQCAYVFQTLNVFGVCVLHIFFNLFYCDNIDNQDILNNCNISVIGASLSEPHTSVTALRTCV